MVLWTVFSAAIGAAITLGVRRQQLKDLLSDMASVEAKLVVVEDKIIAVESDMLRNYVATTTLDKALEPLTTQFHVLHDEIKELRAIILRKLG